MSGLSIFVQAATGQFEAAMEEATRDVKGASMFAAQSAADIIKREGRADIASAGFGAKWQNALKTVVYPKHTVSAHPTIQAYHKIPYSGIFEKGGSIFGKPLLWLPLPTAPMGRGGRRLAPSEYARTIGQPLYSLNIPGKPPMLGAVVRMTNERADKDISLSLLRRGRNPGGRGTVRRVPLYVGVDTVTLRDRFSIQEIAERIAARLPELFAKEFGKG